MRKLIASVILFASALGAQYFPPGGGGSGDATSIRSNAVKSPLVCSDGYVLTYVLANTRFECLASASGFADPTTTRGDLIYHASGGTTRLGIGAANRVLTSDGTDAAWNQVSNSMLAGSIAASKLVGTDIATLGTVTSGTWNGTVVGAQYGGTGLATVTSNALIKGNGTSAMVVTGCTIDSSNNLTCPGTITSGSGSGVAGVLDLTQGTLPGSFPVNTFSLYAPTSISTAYQWRVPAADAAGAIVSDGAGTPGILSIVGFSGTGNIAKVTSPTFVTPTLGAATATSLATATLTASTTVTLSAISGSTQCLHVDTNGVVSGTGTDCGAGGGGGANVALSNLASVSINTSLLAQASVDLGSTTKAFGNLYLTGAGTFGTNYLKFTGTPTSTRTVTFPDATDTVAELGQANVFTAAQSITEAVGASTVAGLTMATSTAATSANQKWSPALILTGNGWDSSASASKAVNAKWDVQPVQNAGNPFSNAVLSFQTNGGGYSQGLQIGYGVEGASYTSIWRGGVTPASNNESINIGPSGDITIAAYVSGINFQFNGTNIAGVTNTSLIVGSLSSPKTSWVGSTGLMSAYGTLATANNGTPAQLGTPQAITARTTSLGTTALYTTASSGYGSAGTYEVIGSACANVAGTAGSTVLVTVSWTDAVGARSFATSTVDLGGTTACQQFRVPLRSAASSAINIATTYSSAGGSPSYNLDAVVVAY
jgi:hypothetical protein